MSKDTIDAPDVAGRRSIDRLLERIDRYRIPLGLVLVVLLLRPLVAQPWALGFGEIASKILIWMLFVAALNLLFGFTGLLSFGHAMFLGFGMYFAAIGLAVYETSWLLAAPAGVLFSGLFGYALARLIVEKGEIYFAMLTLAVNQAVVFVINQDPWGLTGGSNGITQGTVPGFIEQSRGELEVVLGLPFVESVDWYFVVGVVFLALMLGLWQLLRSPFGRSLVAIRDNEDLARAMGVDVERYKTASFTISAMLAAVAGALLEINDHGAALELVEVLTGGDAILMAVLGGVNFFFGPIAGTFVWFFTEDYLTDFETLVVPGTGVGVDLAGVLSYWSFFLGLLFVVVVITSPKNGIWGGVRAVAGRVHRRYREGRS
jgi:branched-chain amino acid transport system permease protein